MNQRQANKPPSSKELTTQIGDKIRLLESAKELTLPNNYNVGNALKGAMLILEEVVDRNKKPVLEVCTPTSITQSLFDMCVQGLSAAKKQGYFVAYGQKLTFQRSYFGNELLAKRFSNVKDVKPRVIYEADEFEYTIHLETNRIVITKHVQKLENLDGKIKGAYVTVFHTDDTPNYVELMTIKDIMASWNMGAAKGNSTAHKNFSGEMAKKSVINRALKQYINSSDDSELSDIVAYTANKDGAIPDNKEIVEAEIEDAVIEEVVVEEPKKVEAKEKLKKKVKEKKVEEQPPIPEEPMSLNDIDNGPDPF